MDRFARGLALILGTALVGCPTYNDGIDEPPTVEDDDTGDDDAGDDDGGDDDTEPPPGHCWTLAPTGGQIAVIDVDIDTGVWFEVGRWGQWVEFAFHTDSIAVKDGGIVACAYQGNDFAWFSLDLTQGTTSWGPTCEQLSIGANSSHLVVMRMIEDFSFYDSYADLLASAPDHVLYPDLHASRVAATDTHVYTAWHSTEEIDVYDINSGAQVDTIYLQGWDTWVWGMSIVGDELNLMHMDLGAGPRFARFDANTGVLLQDVYLPGMASGYTHEPSGLWCN